MNPFGVQEKYFLPLLPKNVSSSDIKLYLLLVFVLYKFNLFLSRSSLLLTESVSLIIKLFLSLITKLFVLELYIEFILCPNHNWRPLNSVSSNIVIGADVILSILSLSNLI